MDDVHAMPTCLARSGGLADGHGDGGKSALVRKGRHDCNPRFQCRVPSFEERNSRRLEVDCLRRRTTNQRRTCLRTSSTLIMLLAVLVMPGSKAIGDCTY